MSKKVTKYKVSGNCTVWANFPNGEKTYTHQFNYILDAIDEADAMAEAQEVAAVDAEYDSGFPLDRIGGTEIDPGLTVREATTTDLLLELPRDVAPLLPGFPSLPSPSGRGVEPRRFYHPGAP